MSRQGFLDEFQKEFKKEGLSINAADQLQDVQSIPTGLVSFDCASGIGGFPKGRIVEIFGPESGGKSLLSIVSLAYAQKMFGAVGLYFDIEGGTPKEWLTTLGVDLNKLDIVPSGLTAEQNFDTIVKAIESEAYTYIIVDSVAGLMPGAELDGSVTKEYMATLARVMSKGIKKVVATLGATKNPPCLICINQLREKPGVMFGCFHYDSRVVLADGTTKRIGEIVKNKLQVEVLSCNNGKIVTSKVIDWHCNGKADKFIKFTVEDYSGPGHRQFLCTPNHHIKTLNGWTEADKIDKGSLVVAVVEKILSIEQQQLIIGSILGAGSLLGRAGNYTATYREEHRLKQTEYLEWKVNLLKPLISQFVINSDRASMTSNSLIELGELRKELYNKDRKKIFTNSIAKKLDWLGIAAWYLDDGCLIHTKRGAWNAQLCIAGFDKESTKEICKFFAEKLGREPYLLPTKEIRFRAEERDILFENIKTFVCPCMQYKLTDKFKGYFVHQNTFETNSRKELMFVKVLNKKIIQHKPSMQKFDITVEGNHNYFVSGINVHNSPETQPGGRALKFYAAQRYRVSKKSQSEKKDSAGDVIGHEIKVVNSKNKLGPPKREAEFYINYTRGVDTVSSLMNMLKDRKAYEKKGQKYILNIFEEPIEFDKVDIIRQKLQEDNEFQLKVYKKLMEKWIGTLPGESTGSSDDFDDMEGLE